MSRAIEKARDFTADFENLMVTVGLPDAGGPPPLVLRADNFLA